MDSKLKKLCGPLRPPRLCGETIRALLVVAALLATACSGNHSEGTEGTATCYTYATDNDSIMLRLNRKENIVEGELTYILYEKDINKGTIAGTMENDTLFADYTFTSEGVTSVREVAFVKRGSDLVEAFGEVDEQNGKFVFRDRSMLTLNERVVLKAVECEPLPQRHRER